VLLSELMAVVSTLGTCHDQVNAAVEGVRMRGSSVATDSPSIAVVGSTMIDMITYARRAPRAGETLIGDRFVTGFGGKGANQAVAARRFGARVAMINCLGDDTFGDMTLANFAVQGIATDHVFRTSGASGVAPIWVEADGTNRIICVPGANEALTAEQASAAVDSIADLDVVIGQFEIPQTVTLAAFRAARLRGSTTILNPAPAAAMSPELMAVTDWLIPNESEFMAVHPTGSGPQTDEQILQAAAVLGSRLVVTLGSHGAALVTSTGQVVRVAAPTVSAMDSTGAGDCFVGTFAFALGCGMSEQAAVDLACRAASMSVTRPGTQSSFPTADEAKQLLSSVA
jgi:ribokinase